MTISGGSFVHNEALELGGGIMAWGTVVNITGGHFENNTARSDRREDQSFRKAIARGTVICCSDCEGSVVFRQAHSSRDCTRE